MCIRDSPYNYLQKPVSKETLFEVLDEIRLDMDDNNCYLTIDAIDNTSTAVNFNEDVYKRQQVITSS